MMRLLCQYSGVPERLLPAEGEYLREDYLEEMTVLARASAPKRDGQKRE